MLTTLKDIFRPTWRKLIVALAFGVPLSLLGLLCAWVPHKPDYVEVITAVLLFPLWVLDFLPWLGSLHKHWIIFLVFSAVQLGYYYMVICLMAALLRATGVIRPSGKEGQAR